VTEAAFEVGFESLSHFHTVFQDCMGASPKQWLNRAPKTSVQPASAKPASRQKR